MREFGIDVSRWQGDFDFKKAASEGVKFVIIKCGGADDGLYRDSKFEDNYRAAKEAGLKTGAYFYGAANDGDAAKKEAAFFASLLSGKVFEYPVFYDVEDKAFPTDRAALTSCVRTFCTAMENAGYWCGFYTNLDWYEHRLDGRGLSERFSFWYAFWGRECTVDTAQLWQFGGSTNLIRGNTVAGTVCDQDYSFRDFPSMIAAKGLNGTRKPSPDADTVLSYGDRVKLLPDATVYGTDSRFADWVYNATLYVRETSGDRVVVSTVLSGPVTGAVARRYLVKIK